MKVALYDILYTVKTAFVYIRIIYLNVIIPDGMVTIFKSVSKVCFKYLTLH